MIYQTDPDFTDVDNHEGCCLFTTAYLMCKQFGIPFIAMAMQSWIKLEYGDGDIIEGDFLQNPQGFCDRIVGAGKIQYLGVLPADYVAEPGVLVSDYLKNDGTGYKHFVVGWTGPGKCEYDPINTWNNYGTKGSNTASNPTTVIDSKRGFRVIG